MYIHANYNAIATDSNITTTTTIILTTPLLSTISPVAQEQMGYQNKSKKKTKS